MSEPYEQVIPYVRHAGTILMAGHSDPAKSSRCAMHFFKKGIVPIDFMCIGAAANHQTAKAMQLFRIQILQDTDGIDVSFTPLRYTTVTVTEGVETVKDCTVWKTVFNTKDSKGSVYEIPRSTKISGED